MYFIVTLVTGKDTLQGVTAPKPHYGPVTAHPERWNTTLARTNWKSWGCSARKRKDLVAAFLYLKGGWGGGGRVGYLRKKRTTREGKVLEQITHGSVIFKVKLDQLWATCSSCGCPGLLLGSWTRSPLRVLCNSDAQAQVLGVVC